MRTGEAFSRARKPAIADARRGRLTELFHCSPNPIYYADLFRINGKVWALTGTGKSDAGMAATARKRDDDLARDSVVFLPNNEMLMGRYAPGAINPEMLNDLHAWQLQVHLITAQSLGVIHVLLNTMIRMGRHTLVKVLTGRLNAGHFTWAVVASGGPASLQLGRAQFDALVLGLPWQRLPELQRICRA